MLLVIFVVIMLRLHTTNFCYRYFAPNPAPFDIQFTGDDICDRCTAYPELKLIHFFRHINIGEHFQALLPDFNEGDLCYFFYSFVNRFIFITWLTFFPGGITEEYMNVSEHADRIWDPNCLLGEDDEQRKLLPVKFYGLLSKLLLVFLKIN